MLSLALSIQTHISGIIVSIIYIKQHSDSQLKREEQEEILFLETILLIQLILEQLS